MDESTAWRASLDKIVERKSTKKGKPSTFVMTLSGENCAALARLNGYAGRDIEVTFDMVFDAVVRSRRPSDPDENGNRNLELPLVES